MHATFITIISGLVVAILLNIIMPHILPKLMKRMESSAAEVVERREVRMDKTITRFYKGATVFVSVVAVPFMIPQVCAYLDINYLVNVIVWCVGLTLVYLSTWIMLKRVEYNDEYFVYINAFGLRRRFGYDEIVKIKYTLGVARISTGKKSFTLFAYLGRDEFIAFITDKNKSVEILR